MNISLAAISIAIRTLTAAKSTLMVSLALCSLATSAHAHEIDPAIVDITVDQNTVRVDIDFALEPIILGMDLGEIEHTDEANDSEAFDAVRLAQPEELRKQFLATWPSIKPKIRLRAGSAELDPLIESIVIPDVGNAILPRNSVLTLVASLPPDGTSVSFGWSSDLGSTIVRQINAQGEVGYAEMLVGGTDSAKLPRAESARRNLVETLLNYTVVGFLHIIPLGLDHIVFVLGLFFFSLALKPLIWQVTAFTLAHSVTLALASLGVISVPASVVEPLIALSIAYVAFENLRGGEITWVRTAVVFAFGLLHGLGFAFVLGDVGLPPSQFLASLFAFNVGVELGQLAVIAVAYLALGLPFGKRSWYRRAIAIPCSLAIGALGVYWTVERVFF
ncbi:MAG: HupE/UreJ family protein [Pseudomonadota bacterium]